ncbi:MAG: AmmeMemoRadiSam system radical SAM enzyme [Chloroflexi bacterium]|nr:AmmeMemoRadiSam system radical SAM enzyme [Chloroflexota bacterium]
MLSEATLYEKLSGGVVRCHVCQWRCKINPGKYGCCKTRLNVDGVLSTLIYGEITSAASDPIEKKPLYHFYPATKVFSVGTWGCNLHCRHCQNWQISYASHSASGWSVGDRRLSRGQEVPPEQLIELAQRYDCAGIAWTYNEPTIWLEYTLDGARLAKKNGLYTVYVTNGFITTEALDLLGPYLDAYRVDLKAFSDEFYTSVTNLPRGRWRGALELAVRAKEKWKMHVEVVTNVLPGFNDGDEELDALSRWVCENLGPDTPWHVTRSHPNSEMRSFNPTPIDTLERAIDLGRGAGLQFIYIGNVPGTNGENTYCPKCGKLAVRRSGYRTSTIGLSIGGKCDSCGADLNFRGVG